VRKYNLIDEKWIPLRMLDGSRSFLGISDTLLRAKEIEAIEDQSPLVVASIYRFLLALLYRALEGPTDIEEAEDLFRDGLSPEKIEAYLTLWKDRFWLFDDKYPFGQIPSFTPKILKAWTTLTAEHNADNAKVLFDHTNVLSAGEISPAKAISGMLATHTFALSAGKSELAHTGTAPSATAMMILPMGANLEETLIFSLVDQNREIMQIDLPMWEREPETLAMLKSGIERAVSGFADLFTWRTRSIRLEETESGNIESLAFASGVKYIGENTDDPMLAYKQDVKFGRLPIQFKARGFWRDFDCIIPENSDLKLAPKVIDHVVKLTRRNSKRRPKSLMILGQSNDKAKIEFWRMERFIWPEAISEKKSIRSEINNLLKTAEETGKILENTCKILARNLLSRGDHKPADKDISNFIKRMTCMPLYWSSLEAQFQRVLGLFTHDRDIEKIQYDWNVAVRDALYEGFSQYENSMSLGNVWEIRALAKAKKYFSFKLVQAYVTKTIKEYEEQLKPKEVKCQHS